MSSPSVPSLKPPIKQVYQIGKAAVERGFGKNKNAMFEKFAEEEEKPEPPKVYVHKEYASKVVGEGSGVEYTILSRVALVRPHSKMVDGDPEADRPRHREPYLKFFPEDNVINITITDGRAVWRGVIDNEQNNIKRIRSGGRDETWKKDYFLTIVSDTLRDPKAVAGMKFFCQEAESRDLSFVIKEMRDSVVLKTLMTDVILARRDDVHPKDVIDKSNDLMFTKLAAYSSKGKLDNAKYWCYMLDDEILCNPPAKSRVQYHCNNCDEDGHTEGRCTKMCSFCRPSCGHLVKECPRRRDERERAKKLLKNPAPKVKQEYGWSLLQLASYSGQLDVVKWLVEEKHADIDKVSQDGFTALMCAAKNGHTHICSYFLQKGTTSVFAVNKAMETAVTYALHHGHRDVVSLLAKDGGPIEVKGREKIGVRNKEPITTMFQLGGRFIGHHEDF